MLPEMKLLSKITAELQYMENVKKRTERSVAYRI
jgi:hypothetical protein